MTDLFEAEATTTTSLDLRRLQRQQRRATRRKWTLVATSVALVLFAIAGSFAWNFLQGFQTTASSVEDYEGAGQGTVQVVVDAGDSGSDIAATLYDAGVIASPDAFIAAARLNPESASITPGYYWMAREMKAEFALDTLLDSSNRDLRTITVPEGKTLEFYYQRIADLTEYSIDDVRAAAEDTESLGLPPEAEGNLEGWLFPSTYEFNPGVHPTDVLAKMVSTTVSILDDNGVAPEDRVEVLTIASLVEREALLDEDRPMIAGVITNRLDIDMPLELDSTVKYLSPTDGVFTSDDERAIDSPYNTYMYPGLPPGAISGPGLSSIEAALAPTDHEFLFFVTVNLSSGETAYAETYDKHLSNVQVLQDWIATNQAEAEAEAEASGEATE